MPGNCTLLKSEKTSFPDEKNDVSFTKNNN